MLVSGNIFFVPLLTKILNEFSNIPKPTEDSKGRLANFSTENLKLTCEINLKRKQRVTNVFGNL